MMFPNNINIINIKELSKSTYDPGGIEAIFIIDRRSILGNPFHMYPDGSNRDEVCDLYDRYFWAMLTGNELPRGLKKSQNERNMFSAYLDAIYLTWQHCNITLACHCAPLRCHGSTIEQYLLKQ
jgi:hypothetical protein